MNAPPKQTIPFRYAETIREHIRENGGMAAFYLDNAMEFVGVEDDTAWRFFRQMELYRKRIDEDFRTLEARLRDTRDPKLPPPNDWGCK